MSATLPHGSVEAAASSNVNVRLEASLPWSGPSNSTTFAPDDHRTYNRSGEAFDVGETFSGVDYETGERAAQEFSAAVPEGVHPAQAAIAWILAQDGVTAAIPAARNVNQSRSNAGAADVTLPDGFDATVHDIYDRNLRAAIHPRW